AVAAMLVGLGLNLLGTLWRGGRLHFHGHAHDGREHLHPHVHPRTQRDATQHHPVRAARRPFVVGLIHGLAGSAALMLGVLATIPSPRLALAYVATFGGGSIGGMIAMSTLLGMPLALAAERFARAELVLRACAAVGSVAVGVLLARATGLPPEQMREGLHAAYRLQPDRRCLAAFTEVQVWFGGHDPLPVSATFERGAWRIEIAGGGVGTLPELPDFGDCMKALERWAAVV